MYVNIMWLVSGILLALSEFIGIYYKIPRIGDYVFWGLVLFILFIIREEVGIIKRSY